MKNSKLRASARPLGNRATPSESTIFPVLVAGYSNFYSVILIVERGDFSQVAKNVSLEFNLILLVIITRILP